MQLPMLLLLLSSRHTICGCGCEPTDTPTAASFCLPETHLDDLGQAVHCAVNCIALLSKGRLHQQGCSRQGHQHGAASCRRKNQQYGSTRTHRRGWSVEPIRRCMVGCGNS